MSSYYYTFIQIFLQRMLTKEYDIEYYEDNINQNVHNH